MLLPSSYFYFFLFNPSHSTDRNFLATKKMDCWPRNMPACKQIQLIPQNPKPPKPLSTTHTHTHTYIQQIVRGGDNASYLQQDCDVKVLLRAQLAS